LRIQEILGLEQIVSLQFIALSSDIYQLTKVPQCTPPAIYTVSTRRTIWKLQLKIKKSRVYFMMHFREREAESWRIAISSAASTTSLSVSELQISYRTID